MNAFSENAILSYIRTHATSDAEFEMFDLPAADIIAVDPKTEVAIHHCSPDGSVLVGVSRFSEDTYRQTADGRRQTATADGGRDQLGHQGRMIITSDRDDQSIVCMESSVTRLDRGVVYTKTIVEPHEEIFIMLGDSSVEM